MGDRSELEERLWQIERERSALDLAIEQLWSVCDASGPSSRGNTLAVPTAGFEHESERELRRAWHTVTSMGEQRNRLNAERRMLERQLETAPAELQRQRPDRPVRFCGQCGGELDDLRSTRAYCSNACRQAAYRERVA